LFAEVLDSTMQMAGKSRSFAAVLALLCAAAFALAPRTWAQQGVGQQAAPPVVAPPKVASPSDGTFQSRINRYKIAPGDSFDINFDLSPEYNQAAVAVQPDGYITLRGVGELKVQGQTVPQLTATLKTAYSKILNKPIISVVLKDFEKPYFVADGQIGKPGKYDLRGEMTLTQAIAVAGGFTDSSKHSQVLLFRRVNDEWMEARIVNVKKMEKEGDLTEDPLLHPGDMLFVPKNTLSKIDHFFPTASMGSFFQPPIP
jgi:polysaccharide export outer membrane protein